MRATCGALIESVSQPIRILAVTGNGATARTTAVATAASVGQSLSRAEPPFFATTLLTGQPKFRSIKSGRTQSTTCFAASAICPAFPPKSCTPIGRSHSSKSRYSRLSVLALPKDAFRPKRIRHENIRAPLFAELPEDLVRHPRHGRQVKRRARIGKPGRWEFMPRNVSESPVTQVMDDPYCPDQVDQRSEERPRRKRSAGRISALIPTGSVAWLARMEQAAAN